MPKQTFSDYKVVKVSGGDLQWEKPCFLRNGRSLVATNKESCHLYNSSSGEHVSQLFTADSPIVSTFIHPTDDTLLIALTETGQVIKYFIDTENEDASCKLSVDIHLLKIEKVPLFKNQSQEIGVICEEDIKKIKFYHAVLRKDILFASWSIGGEFEAHVSTFNWLTGQHVGSNLDPNMALGTFARNFDIANDVFIAMSLKRIYVVRLMDYFQRIYVCKNGMFTCMATNRHGHSFATGDTQGKITIWRNFFEKNLIKDIMHWHTFPVRAIAYTDQGDNLLSGGEENVLVKWSLGNANKTFLPRVSAMILHLTVAPSSSTLAMSTSDSKIHIINMNLKCLSSIQHFSRWSSLNATCPNNILIQDPRTETLVLGGKTGHIQFLNENDGRFLYTLDVTNRNFICGEKDNLVPNVEVRLARFTRCGKWLITAESGGRDTQLKFWSFNEGRQEYALNTDVNEPHGLEIIDFLQVSSDDVVVTCGHDKQFRLWGKVESLNLQQIRLHWASLAVRGFRNLPCSVANFARDGSILGVGFGPALTIWDTETAIFKCSLTPPLRKEIVKEIHFGSHEVSHLVITGTESYVTCWNLVTLCIQWIVPINLSHLVSDLNSSFMCAFSKNRGLFLFQPSSPTPELRLENVCDDLVIAGLFVTNTSTTSLYFLTKKHDLYCFGQEKKKCTQPIEVSKMNPFTSQLAKMSRKDVVPAASVFQLTVATPSAFTTDILDRSPHYLPPVALLCKDIIHSLLLTVPESGNKIDSLEKDVIILDTSKTWEKNGVEESELQRVVENLFKI